MRVPRILALTVLLASVACESSSPNPGPIEPADVSVPDVVGITHTAALESLVSEGFVPVVKRKWTSFARQGEVIRQRPVAGTSLAPSAHVVIVVARELHEVPDVAGFLLKRARDVLQRRGFRVKVVEGSGGLFGELIEPGRVVRTRPDAYAARRPGTVVTVVVKPVPPPVVDTGPECHSAYSGCVPIASDVDCAGGTGNGPVYVDGPVYLNDPPYDPYGLDGNDNDGVGCE